MFTFPRRVLSQGQILNTGKRFYAYKPITQIPVLNRPIGQTEPPSVTDNTGIDHRTREQKKADFVNYDRHLQRRKEMTEEISKSQYQDVYNFRDTKGKMFVAPAAYFRKDKALYMPNFVGRTIKESDGSEYRPTTGVLSGKISIVRIFTSIVGEEQTRSYFNDEYTPYTIPESGFQVVNINLPDNFATEFLVRWYAGKIRETIPDPSRHSRYFIARKGVTKEMRDSLNMENKYAGYIFLVDKQCKIRWAACGTASDEEKASLWKFVAALKREP